MGGRSDYTGCGSEPANPLNEQEESGLGQRCLPESAVSGRGK